MKAAVGYLRVSGKGQVEGEGFGRQRQSIEQWAKAAGYTISGWYEEQGVSGAASEAQRPAFQAMVEDLLCNGVRVIVVECLDRFARDLTVQMQLLAYLVSKELTLQSAITGDDVTAAISQDPMRKAMVQMQGVFAELEKNLLVRKLRKARESKKAAGTGGKEGAKPFGTFPGEPETLRRIKQLRRKRRGGERLSYAKCAEALNKEGHRTRSGKGWNAGTLRNIVVREFPALG